MVWVPIHAQAHLSPASTEAYLCPGLILARTHPCPRPIYSESPRVHPCKGPVHIDGTSLPKAHLSRRPMGAHSCPGPIHGEGTDTSLSRADQVRGLPGTHPCQCPSIPRAHGCPSMPRAHFCPRSIHPEGPWGPSIPMAQSCRGPIPANRPSIPRVHRDLSMARAHLCIIITSNFQNRSILVSRKSPKL